MSSHIPEEYLDYFLPHDVEATAFDTSERRVDHEIQSIYGAATLVVEPWAGLCLAPQKAA